MKKILIVEDTLENMNAAKAFFSTVVGFEFIYATNKEDAEIFLLEADALITDRDLPYFEGDPSTYSPDSGYLLGIIAKMQEKPAVMISEHGELMLSDVNTDSEDFEKVKEIAKKLSNLKGRKGGKGGMGLYHLREDDFMPLVHSSRNIYNFDWRKGTKKDPKSWQIAWERLQKQFKETE